jgi:hypothetical protein
VQWKEFVGATQSGDKTIFEDLDSAFGRIATMHVQWNELVVNVGVSHEEL